ncbi:MAG: glycine oxidase ThiO [Actinobacteria bacterium]|jgi:glycine oxidase|nr:MAG: glycine oxidase ThiO [Actinomycetota bacterium]
MTATVDVTVVGGGPIGLAVAWRCAQRGLRVEVRDPAPGSGASSVAAGMLAPVAEAYFGEETLTRLLVDSAARWPEFAAKLAADTGVTFGYETEGTLIVALTADDVRVAERLRAYREGLGLPITRMVPTALREREPALSPRVRGGAYAPTDHQVDPRRLVDALLTAARQAGVSIVHEKVTDLSTLDARTVVVAAGCGSAHLTGLPIRPVKGQVVRLRAPNGPPEFRHVIRGYVDGRQVYLVPRADGEVVIGATAEERGDTAVTAGAVRDLLYDAAELVPAITEYELIEARAGLRPATPDNAPMLGPLPGRPNVIVATGHYRHGIVLTPVTAELITELVVTGEPDPALAPFRPDRFPLGEVVSTWN